MKKFLAVLLCLVMTVAAFSGCTSTKPILRIRLLHPRIRLLRPQIRLLRPRTRPLRRTLSRYLRRTRLLSLPTAIRAGFAATRSTTLPT